MSEPTSLSTSKRIAIRAVFGGIGLAIGTAAVIGAGVWYANRPRPWNKTALKATWSTFEIGFGGGDTTSYTVKCFYKVQNTTNHDYSFSGSNFIPMALLTNGKTLSRDFGNREAGSPVIDGPSFIPRDSTASITIEIAYLYPDNFTDADKRDFNKVIVSADNRFKELDGFVFYDQANHYEIDLPQGWKDMDGVKECSKAPPIKN